MVIAAMVDWLVCQHEIFRLRLNKVDRLATTGRVRLDPTTRQWLARQARLHRIDRWVSRGFVLILVGFIATTLARLPGFGLWFAAFGVATAVFLVEFVAVRGKLAWSEILYDIRDIKSTVSRLTGGQVGG
jgi:hypothetical protein